MSFSIRRANANDKAGILACLRSAFAPHESSYTREAFADTVLDEGTVEQRLEKMTLLVATVNGSVVGTVGFSRCDGEGHLRGMAVHPEFQGSGLARGLLGAAEGLMQELGVTRVTLGTTEVLRQAQAFYRRNGYQPTGKVGDFFGMELHEFEKHF